MSPGLGEYVELTEGRERASGAPVHSAATGAAGEDSTGKGSQEKMLEHAQLLWGKRASLRNALLAEKSMGKAG